MQAGRLSDLVQFQKRVITELANGGKSMTWADDFKEFVEANRTSETNCLFTMRYRSDITPASHRLIFDGTIWEITSATHDLRRSMLTIDSDFSMLVEVTTLQSTEREFIEGLPLIRPTE